MQNRFTTRQVEIQEVARLRRLTPKELREEVIEDEWTAQLCVRRIDLAQTRHEGVLMAETAIDSFSAAGFSAISNLHVAILVGTGGVHMATSAAFKYIGIAEALSNNLGDRFRKLFDAIPGLKEIAERFVLDYDVMVQPRPDPDMPAAQFIAILIENGARSTMGFRQSRWAGAPSELQLLDALAYFRRARNIAAEEGLPDLAAEAHIRFEALKNLGRIGT